MCGTSSQKISLQTIPAHHRNYPPQRLPMASGPCASPGTDSAQPEALRSSAPPYPPGCPATWPVADETDQRWSTMINGERFDFGIHQGFTRAEFHEASYIILYHHQICNKNIKVLIGSLCQKVMAVLNLVRQIVTSLLEGLASKSPTVGTVGTGTGLETWENWVSVDLFGVSQHFPTRSWWKIKAFNFITYETWFPKNQETILEAFH